LHGNFGYHFASQHPTRMLAADLGVSRRLVVDAYGQLTAERFLSSRQGSGTRVAMVDSASVARHPAPTRRYDVDFLAGAPDLGGFPRAAWLRALRQGLAEIGSESLGYVDPQGLPAARAATADYLRRTRGVQADPRHIVMCSGATQAICLPACYMTPSCRSRWRTLGSGFIG
jgi:GntR family transcriptional regulator / MocR family aminotransferase